MGRNRSSEQRTASRAKWVGLKVDEFNQRHGRIHTAKTLARDNRRYKSRLMPHALYMEPTFATTNHVQAGSTDEHAALDRLARALEPTYVTDDTEVYR